MPPRFDAPPLDCAATRRPGRPYPRRPPAGPARRPRRRSRHRCCATARSPRSATALAAPEGAEVIDGDGLVAVPGVRRPARPSAHARGARTRRTSPPARAPRRPAASARSSRSPTPTPSSTTARSSVRCASARGRRRGSRPASWPRSRSARRVTRSPRWPSSPRSARPAFTDDGRPSRARASCARRSSTSGSPAALIALHEEDPSLSRDGVMHEGAVSAPLGMAGIPSISESTMIARDAQIAAYEDAAHPHPAPLRARVGPGSRAGEGGAASRSPARRARTTSASPTRPCARSTPAAR